MRRNRKAVSVVAVALCVTSLAAIAVHSVVVDGTRWTCENRCMVTRHSNGYDIWDRNGGWVSFMLP